MRAREALKYLDENSKKRNFTQSIELIINLRDLDLKRPDNRIKEEILLPAPLSKPRKVGVIGTLLTQKYKDIADVSITEEMLNEFINDKKKFKKIIKKVDHLLAEPQLMVKITKEFGKMLGTRGKIPRPVPPNVDAKEMIKKLKNTIKINVRDVPIIQVVIGYEDMKEEDILKNYDAVLNAVLKKLPNGIQNIRSVYIKKTMSVPIRVDIK